MNRTRLLRVFTDETGNFGDAASVVIDEDRHLDERARLALARKLSTGETAFINDVESASVSIIHPEGEIDFAGVAALAAAYVLASVRGRPTNVLRARGGAIKVWRDDSITWVQASLDVLPPWHLTELPAASDIETVTEAKSAQLQHTMIWAWMDRSHRVVRARTFAPDWGIPEAEGNGSGSMKLAAVLGKSVTIIHGAGSLIYAKPSPNNRAELGGRITEAGELQATVAVSP